MLTDEATELALQVLREEQLGDALLYFLDPRKRNAFTMAVTGDTKVLNAVWDVLAKGYAEGLSATETAEEIDSILDSHGIDVPSETYSESVSRTQFMQAANAEAEAARTDKDVIDTFPVWQYSNPDDLRSRESHAARNGNYYPADVSFEDVRGTDAGDVINCRCVPIPISKWDWADAVKGGAQIADGYADVPAI